MGQSPIELYETDALTLACGTDLFEIDYPKDCKISGKFKTEKGHANFLVDPPEKDHFPELTFRGTRYQLAKIHLHTHPEHVVGEGEQAKYEIHLIHVPKRGGAAPSPLVVIGILYTLDEKAPANPGVKCLCNKIKINPIDFFPLLEDGQTDLVNWYHYEGSLTTFPYSENVSWFVMRDRGSITNAEIAPLQTGEPQDYRKVQPLDRRLIVRSF